MFRLWKHPQKCVEKSKPSQQAAGTTQLSSSLAPGSGRKLTFQRLLLKLHDDILSQKVSRKKLTWIKEIQAISRPCNSLMSSSQAV